MHTEATQPRRAGRRGDAASARGVARDREGRGPRGTVLFATLLTNTPLVTQLQTLLHALRQPLRRRHAHVVAQLPRLLRHSLAHRLQRRGRELLNEGTVQRERVISVLGELFITSPPHRHIARLQRRPSLVLRHHRIDRLGVILQRLADREDGLLHHVERRKRHQLLALLQQVQQLLHRGYRGCLRGRCCFLELRVE